MHLTGYNLVNFNFISVKDGGVEDNVEEDEEIEGKHMINFRIILHIIIFSYDVVINNWL